MTPAEGLMLVPVKTPILGCPKLARLRILNASARNCKFNPSVMRILLNSEVSKSIRFGPRNWLRPRIPICSGHREQEGLGVEPAVGISCNHWTAERRIPVGHVRIGRVARAGAVRARRRGKG